MSLYVVYTFILALILFAFATWIHKDSRLSNACFAGMVAYAGLIYIGGKYSEYYELSYLYSLRLEIVWMAATVLLAQGLWLPPVIIGLIALFNSLLPLWFGSNSVWYEWHGPIYVTLHSLLLLSFTMFPLRYPTKLGFLEDRKRDPNSLLSSALYTR